MRLLRMLDDEGDDGNKLARPCLYLLVWETELDWNARSDWRAVRCGTWALMPSGSQERILDGAHTLEDSRAAAEILHGLRAWHRSVLWDSLTWPQWVWWWVTMD